MSHLTIAGIVFPVAVASNAEKPLTVGLISRAQSGALRKSVRATKRDLSFKSTPLEASEALAWERLLTGEKCHAWSFDASLYSAGGLGPNAGYVGATLVATHPKFGAKNLSLGATTGTITFAAALGSSWTVVVWRYESAAWHSYVICSSGAQWVDGVRNDAASTTWLSVSSGSATLANTSGAAVEYDDLVLLPFVAPTTWPPVWGVASAAFSPLPFLLVGGDAINEGGTRTMAGEVSDSELVSGTLPGSSPSTGIRVLSVSLSEA